MSEADRSKWNDHYRGRPCAALSAPNALLVEWLPRLELTSRPPVAADVACGEGRHALYLARHGWRVEALDISDVALDHLAATARAEGLDVTCLLRDFEPEPPAPMPDLGESRYDLAVVMRYTNLPLLARVARALRPGGYLVAEAYLRADAPDGGPRNAAYRVGRGEFEATVARDLEVLACREETAAGHGGQAAGVVQVVARRPG